MQRKAVHGATKSVEALISISKAAKVVGINKSTLSRQVKDGTVRSHGGKVRISEVKQDRAETLDPSLRKPTEAEAAIQTVDDAREAVGLIVQVLQDEGAAPPEGKAPDLGMVRLAGEILKAKERQIRIAKAKGEMVPLKAVSAHVSKSFIALRQAFQRFPSRCTAEISAKLGCDQHALETEMSKAIATLLSELSAPVVR